MSSFLFDLISKAKQLDIEGNYVEADRIYSSMNKIAQVNLSESPQESASSGGSPFGYRFQQWFGGGDETRLKTSLKVLNAMVNAAYRVKNYQNQNVIPTEEGIMYVGKVKIKPFTLDADTSKILDQLITELREARDQAKKLVARGTNVNEIDLQIEAYLNQGMGDLTSFVNNMQDSYNHIIYDCRNNSKAKSLLPLLYEGQLKLQQLMHPDMKIDPIVAAQISRGEADAKSNPFDALGNPKSMSGYKEPSSWKEKRMPDAPPSIFGTTVGGSKATIDSGVDKLNNTDDSQFLNIYQGEIETIENAFIANEGKLTGKEKAEYQLNMKKLEDRYYKLLYKDKEKPFVD